MVTDTPRSSPLEEPFFEACSLYFRMTPVAGPTEEVWIFTCQRWRVNREWIMPPLDKVMNGGLGIEARPERHFGYAEKLYASIQV